MGHRKQALGSALPEAGECGGSHREQAWGSALHEASRKEAVNPEDGHEPSGSLWEGEEQGRRRHACWVCWGWGELLVPAAWPRPEVTWVKLTLMYCRSVSARTLKSDTYWPRTELLSWLLLPAKGAVLERSTRSG